MLLALWLVVAIDVFGSGVCGVAVGFDIIGVCGDVVVVVVYVCCLFSCLVCGVIMRLVVVLRSLHARIVVVCCVGGVVSSLRC